MVSPYDYRTEETRKKILGIGNHISQTNIISQQKETSASI